MDLLLKNGVMVMNVKASEILELMNLGLIDAAPTITCNGLSNIPLTPTIARNGLSSRIPLTPNQPIKTPHQPVKPSADDLGCDDLGCDDLDGDDLDGDDLDCTSNGTATDNTGNPCKKGW